MLIHIDVLFVNLYMPRPPQTTTNFTLLATELRCNRATLYRRLKPHRAQLEATGWRRGAKVLFPETVRVIYDVLHIPAVL